MKARGSRKIWIGRVSVAVGTVIVLASGAQFLFSDDPETTGEALRTVVLGSGITLLWISMLTRRQRLASASLGASILLIFGYFLLW